jgi:predicted nuclease of predicted toxin-antitoxin system
MRLLIDECIDQRMRLLFPDHDCQTAGFAGLAGLKNGRLLDAAEAAGFEVLITVDQNIPDQQNLAGRTISILILCAPTNRLRHLEPLVLPATSALTSIKVSGRARSPRATSMCGGKRVVSGLPTKARICTSETVNSSSGGNDENTAHTKP